MILIITAFLLIIGLSYLLIKHTQSRQLAFIKKYRFHSSITNKLLKKYPHFTDQQVQLVYRALRDYFYICNRAKRNMVAMPSQVVDDAWHEFILYTRSYKSFSSKALGRFLHHTPTEAMKSPTLAQDGIKRAWRIACDKEKINPKSPHRLPLLFAIDSILDIPNGFQYSIDCRDKSSPDYGDGYCAGHIGCSSGCSGDSGSEGDSGGFFDGMFDSDSGSNCGSSCGSGCGGD